MSNYFKVNEAIKKAFSVCIHGMSDIVLQNHTEDTLRQELVTLQEEKVNYETTAKVILVYRPLVTAGVLLNAGVINSISLDH